MGVSIIHGAIASGKSRLCLGEIEKVHSENPSARCIMIVPDHYSYDTEKAFVEHFGGIGLNNIEVLTLRRMAISTLTAAELNHLTDAGRQMLIYKAARETCALLRERSDMDIKLISSMQRQGFLDVAASLISEMKRYLVTPENLLEKANEIEDNRTLKNKLLALSALYGKYNEYVAASGGSDGEDDLRLLAEHIENENEYDENTYVWVNRFDKLMPQQLCVLEALLKKGVHMTISVCYPADGGETEKDIYAETRKTYDTALRLAKDYGFEGEREAGKGLSHLKDKPDLYMLLSRWNEDFEYDRKPANMGFFEARDTYSEIERIACEITDLARGGECRYGDIALMCGNEDEYIHLIEAVFSEYDIPYFTDRKIILSDHPIAMQILSLFDIIEENWSYESVFRYLRSGFVYHKTDKGAFPLNQEKIDELENLVLKYGIRGEKRWLSEEAWISENDIVGAAFADDKEKTDGIAEFIDDLRREIAAPVERFVKKVGGKSKKNGARDIAAALFEYLEDIHLYEGLRHEINAFKREGMVNEAEQFTKIWNLILDVLNQTASALPADEMNVMEFAEYMNVGLSKCEIRTIPSGIDQVYVGSAERISHTSVKVMFVVGAKSGTFPTGIKTEGFLSNKDRNTLKDSFDITLAPDTKKKTDEQYFKVYRALCAVSEKLYLSYSIQDGEGNAQTASHMLLEIARKFPRLDKADNLSPDASKDFLYISSPKATLHKMIYKLSDRYTGQRNALWDIIYDWYKDKEEWQRPLSLIKRADYYDRRGVVLDKDIANMLYEGKIEYSASRLNTLASCRFRYYLEYGLGARKREEWELNSANMGSYAHRVINDFCKEVEKDSETSAQKLEAWKTLDENRRGEILGSIIDKTCENMLSSNVRDKERTASIFRRMGKTISEAASLVQRSLSAGSFSEEGMESFFSTDISDNIALRGVVDRVDVCETDDRTYLRIIDYKTGRTAFDVVNIANGYDMQMVLYAIAMKEIKKSEGTAADIAGIYYTGIKSKYREMGEDGLTEDNIKERNSRDMRLDGVTFAAEDGAERRKMLHLMDNGLFENQESAFTNVSLDEDGEAVNVGTLEEINGLMDYVKAKVIEMDGDARDGRIELNPYKSPTSRSNVCAYCDYKSVCKFDERLIRQRDAAEKSEEVWEAMQTRGAALKGSDK